MQSLSSNIKIDLENNIFIKSINMYGYIKISQIIFIEAKLKNNFQNTILNIKYDLEKNKIYYPYIHNLKNIIFFDIKHDQDDIKKIAKLIKEIQCIKIEKSNISFNYKNFLLYFFNQIKKELSINKIEKIEYYIKNHVELIKLKNEVIAHQDLHIGNFVKHNKNILIIDWDYASINNRYFDIASFISESIYNKPNHILYFLKQFQYNKKDIKYLKQIIEYQNILWFCWAKYMFIKTKNNTYKNIYKLKWNLYINKSIEQIIN